MPSCILCARTRNAKSVSSRITFHKIPSNEVIRKKWCDFLLSHGFDVKSLSKNSVLCSTHFDPKFFISYNRTRLLQQNAVPSIIVSRVKNAKTHYPEWISSDTKSEQTSAIQLITTQRVVKMYLNTTEMCGESSFDEPLESKQAAAYKFNVAHPADKVSLNTIEICGVSSLDEPLESKQTAVSKFNVANPAIKMSLNTTKKCGVSSLDEPLESKQTAASKFNTARPAVKMSLNTTKKCGVSSLDEPLESKQTAASKFNTACPAVKMSIHTTDMCRVSSLDEHIESVQTTASTFNMAPSGIKMSLDTEDTNGTLILNNDNKSVLSIPSEFNIACLAVKHIKPSYTDACQPVTTDTPNSLDLKQEIAELSYKLAQSSKKVKVLQQKVRRQNKKIASMKGIILQLKKKNFIDDNISNILLNSFGKHTNLVTNWAKKNLGQKVAKKISPEVRQFALSLHSFSAKAYEYVRKEFNTILPNARTLRKLYTQVNAEPHFTEEALKALALKAKKF